MNQGWKMDTPIVASGCGESNGILQTTGCAGIRREDVPCVMKHLSCLFVLLALALLSQCAGPPPAPGDRAFHGRENTAYRLGYHHGFMDGERKAPENFERHRGHFTAETRDAFAAGYHSGFDAGRHSASADEADQDIAYQNGYDAGAADAVNGIRPDHTRYRSRFGTASEPSFREGYEKGWHDAREQ